MNNNLSNKNKNKIYPIRLSKNLKTIAIGNIKDLKDKMSQKFNINNTLKNFKNKNDNLNNYKESPMMKNIISLNKSNSPYNTNLKKAFSSFNLIKVSPNLAENQIITSNITKNLNKENKNFEKIIIDNTETLCYLIKVFKDKISEIIQWLITKSSSIKYNKDNLFYYQLTLFQKQVAEFQNKIILYFKKLIEDLHYSQNDENLDVLGPNLNNFYYNIRYINDFLLQRLKKRNFNFNNNNSNNNNDCQIYSSLTTKNISYDIKLKNNKLPFLKDKKDNKDKNNGYSMSRNNFHILNNNNIVDEIVEEINNSNEKDINRTVFKNKNKVKKLFLLKETENIFKDKIKKDDNSMDDEKEKKEDKDNLSGKKENRNNDNNNNIIDIYQRDHKFTISDIIKNVTRRKKNNKTLRNIADFII